MQEPNGITTRTTFDIWPLQHTSRTLPAFCYHLSMPIMKKNDSVAGKATKYTHAGMQFFYFTGTVIASSVCCSLLYAFASVLIVIC